LIPALSMRALLIAGHQMDDTGRAGNPEIVEPVGQRFDFVPSVDVRFFPSAQPRRKPACGASATRGS
jgi:hypothetical protein